MSRKLAERRVLESIRERCSTPEAIHQILTHVEQEVARLHGHVPEEIKLKRAALLEEDRRIENFVEFIADGKGSRALADALHAAENKAAAIRDSLQSLEATATDVFKAPPIEWVAFRLQAVQDVLESETATSALLLRRVLGTIKLRPVRPEVGRSYYEAETALQILELIQGPQGGSNSLKWWRRWELNPRPKTLSRRRLRR